MTIRAVETDHNRPIGILVDLQGPKLRLGAFANNSAVIDKGHDFILDNDATPGDATRVNLPHPEIFAAIKPGDALLIDDGKLRLVAIEATPQRIVTRVEVGGKVSNRKGVSLPDTVIPLAALTPKDLADLEAALDAGIDWVALSFIQRPEDIAEAKKITRGRAAVMAKIEKPQAVARLGEILDLADALMVARGDLGVEMPLEKVPGVQKEMTRACRHAGKPVVVATQMLESMIDQSGADAGRGVRRRDRDLRRRRRRDAVGGIGVRSISDRGGDDDEPHRRGSRKRRDVSAVAARVPNRARTYGRRCHRGGSPAGRRDSRPARHRMLDELGLDRLTGLARTAQIADHRHFADHGSRPEVVGRLGHPLRDRRGRARSGRHGRSRVPPRVQRRLSPKAASAFSSWPACRSARPARPTSCASPSSEATSPARDSEDLAHCSGSMAGSLRP